MQYAAPQTVADAPHIDQRTLARAIGLDTSTIAGLIDRLAAPGLMLRSASPENRRVWPLSLTAGGRALLKATLPSVPRAQERRLEPLPNGGPAVFLRMRVTASNDLRRAPIEA